MLRVIYTVGFTLLTPFLILRLWYKSLRAPLYRQRVTERFGLFRAPPKKGGIWIHAVSVGEVVAAIPIVQRFQKAFPDQPITFTTMTPTGSKRVIQAFGTQVFHLYIPYDFPLALNRFFEKISPRVCVLLETELWPNVLWGCQSRNIPVILANGHLSLRSVRGYNRISAITKSMMGCLTAVAAQSQQDAEHFITLGLDPLKLSVTGNIKFDVSYTGGVDGGKTMHAAFALRKSFGLRPVWIAASTHPGEEILVLEAFKGIRIEFPDALLILVPRHPERFKGVEALIQQQGFSVVTRSSGVMCDKETAVFLGDTMGELLLLYQAADMAFVGGSLVPIGGHNLLEPAALGVFILTGPYVHNYVDISKLLLKAGGMRVVNTPEELKIEILHGFSFSEQRRAAGCRAQEVVHDNQGAANKVFDNIFDFFN